MGYDPNMGRFVQRDPIGRVASILNTAEVVSDAVVDATEKTTDFRSALHILEYGYGKNLYIAYSGNPISTLDPSGLIDVSLPFPERGGGGSGSGGLAAAIAIARSAIRPKPLNPPITNIDVATRRPCNPDWDACHAKCMLEQEHNIRRCEQMGLSPSEYYACLDAAYWIRSRCTEECAAKHKGR